MRTFPCRKSCCLFLLLDHSEVYHSTCLGPHFAFKEVELVLVSANHASLTEQSERELPLYWFLGFQVLVCRHGSEIWRRCWMSLVIHLMLPHLNLTTKTHSASWRKGPAVATWEPPSPPLLLTCWSMVRLIFLSQEYVSAFFMASTSPI
jgi:hypothetical protein